MDIYRVAAKQLDNGKLDLIFVAKSKQTDICKFFAGFDVFQNYEMLDKDTFDLDILKDRTETESGNYILLLENDRNAILKVYNHLGVFIQDNNPPANTMELNTIEMSVNDLQKLSDRCGTRFPNILKVKFPNLPYVWMPKEKV